MSIELDAPTEKALRAQVKELVTKIVEHYTVVERIRREDRDLWKLYSKRLEHLEELKSERGKKRKYRRKKTTGGPTAPEPGYEKGGAPSLAQPDPADSFQPDAPMKSVDTQGSKDE